MENARNRLNNSALCNNYKVNKSQKENGDITIMERIDMKNEMKKNKEFLHLAYKPNLDHGLPW